MKKTKEAKEEKTKNKPEMKICEHSKSIANTNWWVSQLKRVFFLESRRREWVFFFFFLFSAFSYLSILSFFCLLLYFLLHFVTCILRKSMSLFLCLSTFQVINMGFLNEKCGTKVWSRGYLDVVIFFWES